MPDARPLAAGVVLARRLVPPVRRRHPTAGSPSTPPPRSPPAIAVAVARPVADRRRRPASADAGAIYDAIEQQVDRDPRAPAEPAGRPPGHRRGRAPDDAHRASSTEQTPPDYVAANERLYKALGLLPAGRQPARPDPRHAERRRRRLLPRRPGQAVRGLEDRAAPGATEQITFAHEFDHALQDQNFTVFKDQDGDPRPGRPDPRPAGRLRGRRDPADDPLGGRPT